MTTQKFLITGASSGIGEVYADRLAKRGHDLVLVARRVDKLAELADRLTKTYDVAVETLAADLARPADLEAVAERLRRDSSINGLVNNAGIAGEGPFVETDPAHFAQMIALNVSAVTQLSAAIAPRIASVGQGTIINITSVLALMPTAFCAVYPATKAFVLAFSEALAVELGRTGVRVQAVLPGITRTAIWKSEQIAQIPAHMVMDVETMVDAALAGLDLGETITIPSLPDSASLAAYLEKRAEMQPNLSRDMPAARYAR